MCHNYYYIRAKGLSVITIMGHNAGLYICTCPNTARRSVACYDFQSALKKRSICQNDSCLQIWSSAEKDKSPSGVSDQLGNPEVVWQNQEFRGRKLTGGI